MVQFYSAFLKTYVLAEATDYTPDSDFIVWCIFRTFSE
jgi:hypothetical protein